MNTGGFDPRQNRGFCVAAYFLLFLVGLDGLEPSTSRLSGARSNHLSYRPLSRWHIRSFHLLVGLPTGGDDGNRTHDPLLAGQVLSQLSYTPSGVFENLTILKN